MEKGEHLKRQNRPTMLQLQYLQGLSKVEMKVALALYPVSMKQLMDIADTGNIMPPKTTWFEPKLRSGLVIHKLD